MPTLDLKVPPPAVAAGTALLMWLLAEATPELRVAFPGRVALALVIAFCGALIAAAGLIEFRRARTTVNPMKPDTASTLVTAGVYGLTRNPMYVGLAIVLVAWGVALGSALALLVIAGFVAYMNRFQIVPEEKALAARFGAAFDAYRSGVRRWL